MAKDESLNNTVEEFIQRRVIDCGKAEHCELQEGYARLEDLKNRLEATFSEDQRKLFRKLLNEYSTSDGETMQVYYRAGFADAMQFVFGWSKDRWQTDGL